MKVQDHLVNKIPVSQFFPKLGIDLFVLFLYNYVKRVVCVKGKRKLNGKRDSNIIYSQRTQNKLHPTQKPTYLIRIFVSKSSEMNDVVYDPFMGSGTTAIACIKEKRRWIGSEINYDYAKESEKRIDTELNQLKLF